MKWRLIFLLFLLSGSLLSMAQVMTPDTDEYGVGSWWCFRKEFHLDSIPSESILHIAADSKYWLWVNGELQILEGGLKRGPNPRDTYKDVIHNLKGLKKGANVVAVLVWHFGKHGFSHRNSGTAGLYFVWEAGKQNVRGDSSWTAIRHPAFYVPEGRKPNYRLPESNIGFDASSDIPFHAPSFNASSWKPVVMKSLEEAGWNALYDRSIPMWKDFGLKEYKDVEMIGDTLLCAYLPYNAQVTPYIKLKSNGGQKIDIRTDNYMGGGTPNVYAEYITTSGVQEFEAYGWMNGHEVHYSIPEGVEVLDVKYRETGYDTEFAGSFRCDDPFLNTLWQKSIRTLYITMRDTYMDCPDRERAQWWGDVVIELGEALYALDSRAHELSRKAIRELIDWQRADSTLFSPVPAGNWEKELPMQMLASVGYYGFWMYYMGTGDAETIHAVYPGVKRYMHVWQLTADGLVAPREVGWTWGDWGENKDMELLFNLWYSIALDGYVRMARLVGDTAEADWGQEANDKLKTAFHLRYWNGRYYASPGYSGLPDDRPQALAIVADVLPESLYPAIRPFFGEQYHASPYMEKYVLQAQCKMGYHTDALQRMRHRYKTMVESELTTLWEGWGIGSEGFGGGSYNHAWSGGPLTIMSQYIAGVSTICPGFSVFEVKPNLGDLTYVETVVPTERGSINVSLNVDKGEQDIFLYRLQIPEGSTGYVYLPAGCKTYWRNGKKIPKKELSGDVDVSKKYYKLKLHDGIWTFRGE